MFHPRVELHLKPYPQTVKEFLSLPESGPSQNIRSLCLDQETLWCGTDEALLRLQSGQPGKVIQFARIPSPLHDLCVHTDLGLLVAAAQGLFRLQGQELVEISLPDEASCSILHLKPGLAGTVLAASQDTVFQIESASSITSLSGPPGRKISSIAVDGIGRAMAATDRGIWVFTEDRWEMQHLQESLGYFLERNVKEIEVDGAGQIWATQGSHLAVLSPAFHWRIISHEDGLPVGDIRCIAIGPQGEVWIGTGTGAARLLNGKWSYFASRRWLPHDEVRAIVVGKGGTAFLATADGIASILTESMTLERKTAFFENVVKSRHWRYGIVAMSVLDRPGDLSSWRQEASDNDGCWTSVYVAAECFRYAVTGSQEARNNAMESFRGMQLLEELTPLPGLVARSVHKKGENILQSGGEWHETEDGQWMWKGDTSSDEMAGDFFAWSIYYDLIGIEEERQKAANLAGRVMDYLMDHDYNLVDVDGEVTTWGVYSPAMLNSPGYEPQKGLNSLEILSHLKATYHMTGDDRYQKGYLDLVENHRYALNTIDQQMPVPKGVPWDHQLAMLSYYPLFKYEQDPFLRNIYLQSLQKTWQAIEREHCPFWTFIYGWITGHPVRLYECVKWLQDVPLDMITWDVKNSARKDIVLMAERDYTEQLVARDPIPMSERRLSKLDKGPYRLDGGTGGRTEDDGAFFLLCYWMGRHLGFLKEVPNA